MTPSTHVFVTLATFTVAGFVAVGAVGRHDSPRVAPRSADANGGGVPAQVGPHPAKESWLGRGVDWLARAQHEDGGWGAGSSGRQDVRDAAAVQTDPATTAFTALALVRAGSSPTSGPYRENVRKALTYVVTAVETSEDGPRVTKVTGTQPQAKMGPLVDTSLSVQFLSRVVPMIPLEDPLRARADAALDTALAKLRASQTKTGEWGAGGWANSLQGSLGAVAYEMAAGAGKEVPVDAMDRARGAQQARLDPGTGRAEAGGSAGVELYAWAGAARNSAVQSYEARRAMEAAMADGRLDKDAEVTEANLRTAGVPAAASAPMMQAYRISKAQTERLDDASLLAGFGNNGGEEFLSYMMTSEALVIAGGEDWTKWRTKMDGLLQKIQSAEGSWTGHHCITSPVFCTAAVVQAMTAERDVEVLRARQKTTDTAKNASAK